MHFSAEDKEIVIKKNLEFECIYKKGIKTLPLPLKFARAADRKYLTLSMQVNQLN